MKIKSKSKKIRLFAVSVIILAAVGVAAFVLYTNRQTDIKSTKALETPSSSDKQLTKNLSDNPDNKSNPVNTDQPETTTPNENDKQEIEMFVSTNTSNDNVYVRGGASILLNDSGECYAEITGPDNVTIRKNTTLLQNASTTDCKTITIPNDQLSTGTWSAQLFYSSETAKGTSNVTTFEIN